MGYRIGVDIGGTFTDFCVFDERTRELQTLKVLSTPDRPGAEMLDGLAELQRRYGVSAGAVSYFTHGTTVGVNTVIQRRGVNLCLITTAEFEDVLEVARLKMPDPYDLFSRRPAPLVPREKVFGVAERVLADGTVEREVDEASVLRALDGIRAAGGEAVVVALLHAYRTPGNEDRVREILNREAPDLTVICSSRVWPVIREYERTVTSVVAGYVQPRVARYLDSLQKALAEAGVPAEPMITKSNGGVMSAELGKTECVQMLLSGTASGVIGASHVARLTGSRNTMSFDVGGTSADVAVIMDGEPQYGVGEMIGEFPIYVPTVSVTSIGEGGGSIAWVDRLGVLKVGPESAGSVPGPACYGRGGERPTITDAFVVCGFLGAAELGYSAVRMDTSLAEKAIATVAGPLGKSVRETAESIIRIAISGMYLEISKLVSRYGVDPRDFSLLAFGGAGPMTACFLARELGMKRLVVPLTPGVLSAFGGLIADVKNDFIRTVFADLEPAAAAALRETFRELAGRATHWLREQQGFTGEARYIYSADMRYRGQSFEIETLLEHDWIETGDVAAMAEAFHRAHEQLYEHADPEAPIQVINQRLVVAGSSPKPQVAEIEAAAEPPEPLDRMPVYYDGRHHEAALYRRAELRAGQRFAGPAVVLQDDCTTCVLGGFVAEVDSYGNLILTAEG
ncbi:hydantoinase/oxoprolinase family protein [Thalassobaculum sp.]|uniref:hydantoinase/oxoprolinase family protein n=1 Tax=Thalassobaculum sp. TaxID=2022740 RepID=UPI0032ED12BD